MVIRTLIWLIEGVFAAGMIGSAVVVVLTTIEDFDEFLGKKKED